MKLDPKLLAQARLRREANERSQQAADAKAKLAAESNAPRDWPTHFEITKLRYAPSKQHIHVGVVQFPGIPPHGTSLFFFIERTNSGLSPARHIVTVYPLDKSMKSLNQVISNLPLSKGFLPVATFFSETDIRKAILQYATLNF